MCLLSYSKSKNLFRIQIKESDWVDKNKMSNVQSCPICSHNAGNKILPIGCDVLSIRPSAGNKHE